MRGTGKGFPDPTCLLEHMPASACASRLGQTGGLFAPQCPCAQHPEEHLPNQSSPWMWIMLCSAQDAAGNINLCFKGTRSAPPKGRTSLERDCHLPSRASPQGFCFRMCTGQHGNCKGQFQSCLWWRTRVQRQHRHCSLSTTSHRSLPCILGAWEEGHGTNMASPGQ